MISLQKSRFFNKINFQNIFIVYILLQPIIDIITSLCVRNISETLSLGIVIRVFFMLFVMIYSIIKVPKKDKIKLIIYYSFIALYAVVYLVNSYLEYSFSMVFTQIKGIVKVFYFPIILISLYEINKENNFTSLKKYLNISLIIYVATIIICRIFSAGYPTYLNNDKFGSIGLFYAGNETSAILAMLAPICFWKLINEKFSIINFIVCIATIFTMLEIKTIYKQFIAISLMIILSFSFVAYTPAGKNTNIGITWGKSSSTSPIPQAKPSKPVPEETQAKFLSGRNNYLKNTFQKYNKSSFITKLTGTGYISYSTETGIHENKLVEIDYFDIFFCHGILGTLIYIIPLILIAISLFKKLFSNFVVNIKNNYTIFTLYAILMGCGIALLAGHVFTAPAVSIFLAINILELFNTLKSKEDLINE